MILIFYIFALQRRGDIRDPMWSDTSFWVTYFLLYMKKNSRGRLNKGHEHISDFLKPSKKDHPQTQNVESQMIYTKPKQNA